MSQLPMTFDGLQPAEGLELLQLETTIERGLATFVEVGGALLRIREGGLYKKAGWKTFEDYCRERWSLSRPRAYQLMEAASIAVDLSTTVDKAPESERQVRPLAALPKEDQPKAWARAVETSGGKPTARHVEAAVQELRPAPPAPAPEPEPAAEPPSKMAVHFSSETPEHYTPLSIIELAAECLGTIDLDPCSNSHESPNVPARRHFTEADDGLAQEWRGTVYMNPPYGREIGAWIEKLCTEFRAGRVTEAIALVPSRTDTGWWNAISWFPVCLVYGRLRFGEAENSAPFPSAVFYLGANIHRFHKTFEDLGGIWRRLYSDEFEE